MSEVTNVDTAIKVDGISKTFKLPHEKHTSIKGLFVNRLRKRRSYEKQRVLNNISFDVKKGEFFGIVGRNGSGKSTLLKILAGIYRQNKGEITINGKLTPFIELGVGFNPELSGRENVYLNGALLGIGRKEMDELYNDIVEFAELENFMDQKLKNYSSGMQVRLAFSIAIRAKGDILLLDEVLAVGDAAFQKKCLDYFNELKRNKQTVVLVTHDMNSVERFCDRAMLIESGEIYVMGKSTDVAREYEEMFIKDDMKKNNTKASNDNIYTNDKVKLSKYEITQNGKKTSKIKALNKFTINLTITATVDIKSFLIGINIKNYEGRVVMTTDNTMHSKLSFLRANQPVILSFTFDNILTNGIYSVNIGAYDVYNGKESVLEKRTIMRFMISGIEKYRDSLVHPKIEVDISEK